MGHSFPATYSLDREREVIELQAICFHHLGAPFLQCSKPYSPQLLNRCCSRMAIFSTAFLVLSLLTLSPKPTSSFSFPSFHRDPSFDSQIALFGDAAVVDADSSIRITRPSVPSSGFVIYREPIFFFDPNPKKIASFSTFFSFSISPGSNGIAFFAFPAKTPFETDPSELLRGSVCVLAVQLDASDRPNRTCERIASLRGSSVLNSVADAGETLHCWIDYDSGLKKLEVRLNKSGLLWPSEPLVSYQTEFPEIWKGEVFVGIISSSENSTKTSSVYSWSFELKRNVSWAHSEPLDPRAFPGGSRHHSVPRRSGYIWKILTAAVFGVGCGLGVAVLVLYAWSIFVDRRSRTPPAKECPLHPVDFDYEKITTVAVKDADVGKKQGI